MFTENALKSSCTYYCFSLIFQPYFHFSYYKLAVSRGSPEWVRHKSLVITMEFSGIKNIPIPNSRIDCIIVSALWSCYQHIQTIAFMILIRLRIMKNLCKYLGWSVLKVSKFGRWALRLLFIHATSRYSSKDQWHRGGEQSI